MDFFPYQIMQDAQFLKKEVLLTSKSYHMTGDAGDAVR
jgi:hypothetical protein